jgi:hypothetical protein
MLPEQWWSDASRRERLSELAVVDFPTTKKLRPDSESGLIRPRIRTWTSDSSASGSEDPGMIRRVREQSVKYVHSSII